MARFLSGEWFESVRAALSGPGEDRGGPDQGGPTPPVAPDNSDVDLGPGTMAVRHRVTGGPDGDVDYVVRASSGRFSIEPGGGGPVDVDIAEDYDCAAAISQGRLTPTAAFATGRIALEGDVALLAARQRDFAALADLLAPVRAVTTY
ncbi:MAG TPA: SCP2 sterol-binding domain-containing protein [Acidimicrobiales bacterium]|nr:SCP2 sterol-binding domain-containing protein [Acidimicrobiales bacterium]